ncbi:Phenylacetate-coenzyme A ligase [Legionella busanensis]|uniref:Phenylacetate-coenzyme A ligase n=1 Tax=Legionella busanensis TaxID=190655 RepID=A0A378JL99_9GAMM|nr:phenylacetate--CoA ligase family protein [Legionella busanensis]STX50999.1 Phenylacetate-coenzyme A ligase [Legionella busanensis]
MASIFLEKKDQTELVDKLNNLMKYMTENFSAYKSYIDSPVNTQIECLEDLVKFPILDKKESVALQLSKEVLDRNPLAYFETSGTSGSPFPVIPDFATNRSQEFADFINEWLDLDNHPIKRAVIALPFEMNPVGLKYFLALNQLNIMSIPVGVRTHLCPPKKVIDIFERLKPELLIARPMETLRYAEAMETQGLDPKKSSIKKIILTGEIVSKAKFDRISQRFGGADVHSVYGLTELDSGGMVSCHKHQYHLPSKPYLVAELLQDDFKTPVMNDGDIGNIVLTNTHQNYMPLFRYKTGDYGVLKKQCNCNQFQTPIINLLGRSSDKISYNDKVIFPIQIEDIIFQFDQIASDYQIISSQGEISLRLEWLNKHYDPKEVEAVKDEIQANIFNQLGINLDDIQILETGKLYNKLGIAKSKAGTLVQLDKESNPDAIKAALEINFSCIEEL